MPQIALLFDESIKGFDLAFADDATGPDLIGDMGYLTAINISLFTDRRAPVSELESTPHGEREDPRGWWGDWLSQADDQLDEIGSLLWLLERAKDIPETVNRARRYAEGALAWLSTPAAGALQAEKVLVTAESAGDGVLELGVAVSRPGASGQLVTLAWRYVYNYQSGEYYALEPPKP